MYYNFHFILLQGLIAYDMHRTSFEMANSSEQEVNISGTQL